MHLLLISYISHLKENLKSHTTFGMYVRNIRFHFWYLISHISLISYIVSIIHSSIKNNFILINLNRKNYDKVYILIDIDLLSALNCIISNIFFASIILFSSTHTSREIRRNSKYQTMSILPPLLAFYTPPPPPSRGGGGIWFSHLSDWPP